MWNTPTRTWADVVTDVSSSLPQLQSLRALQWPDWSQLQWPWPPGLASAEALCNQAADALLQWLNSEFMVALRLVCGRFVSFITLTFLPWALTCVVNTTMLAASVAAVYAAYLLLRGVPPVSGTMGAVRRWCRALEQWTLGEWAWRADAHWVVVALRAPLRTAMRVAGDAARALRRRRRDAGPRPAGRGPSVRGAGSGGGPICSPNGGAAAVGGGYPGPPPTEKSRELRYNQRQWLDRARDFALHLHQVERERLPSQWEDISGDARQLPAREIDKRIKEFAAFFSGVIARRPELRDSVLSPGGGGGAGDAAGGAWSNLTGSEWDQVREMIRGKALSDFRLERASTLQRVDKYHPLQRAEFAETERRFKLHLQGRNEDYVANRIRRRKPPIRFELIGLERVTNVVLQCRFAIKRGMMELEREPHECRVRTSFHATGPRNIASLCTLGLLRYQHKLNPATLSSDEGYFGSNARGVYVSCFADYTLKYANEEGNWEPLRPGDTVRVIMFKTLPGREKRFAKAPGAIPPARGFDSHKSPEGLEWFLFDESQACPEYVCEVRAVEDTQTSANEE